ncbi:DUF885 domain-containing protein [Maricaulis salignorans]|uniref:Uncharacterized conserved protein, DUF885 familyt n=1 Tax=Maricaulis salignorans TaxID=144026 RepID=A0A1G9LGF0_9PROT|nr:DUF885 domain-containing protein [Maricaulis salignorans]SDL61052.1 Uncharacterized conserved protein, DUF885 familyt [Maricaulis salignorans]
MNYRTLSHVSIASLMALSLAACGQQAEAPSTSAAPASPVSDAAATPESPATPEAPADADASAAFAALVSEFEAFELANNPEERGRRGDLEAAGQWGDISAETLAARFAAEAAFLERLDAIDAATLSQSDQVSHAVLDYILRFRTELAPFGEARIAFDSDSGFFFWPSYAAASARPRTIAEGEAWITRINGIAGYFQQNTDWMRRGLETGFTQPRIITESAATQVEGLSDAATLRAILIEPIDNLPTALPAAERARLYDAATAAIDNSAQPAFAALASFLRDEYLPQTRDSLGVSETPEGRAYYQTLVRYHTTLDTSPEEVHQRGLAEVARIRGEMETVIAESGFEGSFAEFLHFLRTDPQFYATTAEELLMHAAWIAKRLDDQMPAYFGHLPRLSYGVRPVPDTMAPSYTTGRYWPGDMERGIAGGYMVNTYDLTQRPLYTLPALTAHEAVPGHHHQGSIAAELEDVPDFRRNTYITAFGEGWGLYSETLGRDMGIYTTPYEEFGRLSYEMWRACRLVVDTGVHYMGWTRDQAEACFLENSALAPHNIRTEVLRYISWPGQALAYKTGELLMRDLRGEAEERLGEDFDIRAFHDVLLADGSMPLSTLEAKMRRWINEEEAGNRN